MLRSRGSQVAAAVPMAGKRTALADVQLLEMRRGGFITSTNEVAFPPVFLCQFVFWISRKLAYRSQLGHVAERALVCAFWLAA